METKKSLIIAIAMFVFSGILGLVEAGTQDDKIFNTIKVESRINIDVELKIGSDVHLHDFVDGKSGLDFSVYAGETRIVPQHGRIPSYFVKYWVNPMELNSKLTFKYQEKDGVWPGGGSDNGIFEVWDDEYGWGPIGDVTIVMKVVNKTLCIMIDTQDSMLKYAKSSDL